MPHRNRRTGLETLETLVFLKTKKRSFGWITTNGKWIRKKKEKKLILTPNNYEKFEKSRWILLVDTQEILRAFVFLNTKFFFERRVNSNSIVEKEGKGFICTLFHPDLAKYNILSLAPRFLILLERRSHLYTPIYKDAWWWIRQGQV